MGYGKKDGAPTEKNALPKRKAADNLIADLSPNLANRSVDNTSPTATPTNKGFVQSPLRQLLRIKRLCHF